MGDESIDQELFGYRIGAQVLLPKLDATTGLHPIALRTEIQVGPLQVAIATVLQGSLV